MKLIDFSKSSDDEIMYADPNSYLNILDLQEKSFIQTSEKINNHPFDQVSYSYDGRFIIYTLYAQNYHFLKIVPIEFVMINSYMMSSVCSFYTSGNILNFYISPNKNRIAIYFTVVDIFFDMITGKSSVGIKDQNKYFLHVYEFGREHRCSLILNKRYPDRINVSLSELDTIAISSNVNPSHGSTLIEIYNLDNKRRIAKTVVAYPIFHMKFLPETELYHNNLLVISLDIDAEKFYMKIIDLQNKFTEKYNKLLDADHILSIDISRNVQIALGTDNGLLYFTSLDQEPVRLYGDKMIIHISFSISGQKVAVVFFESDQHDQEDEDEADDVEQGQKYLFSVFHFLENTEIFNSEIADTVYENYFINKPQVEPVYNEDAEDNFVLAIRNPFLDRDFPVQITNQEKLQQHGSHTCFDINELNEENIGTYLTSDPDNIVLFVKTNDKPEFAATCLKFSNLKNFLKDPTMIFYRCVDGMDYRQYSSNQLEYLKLPTGGQTIFVNYRDIKDKYKQRQNMIFVELEEKIEKTISFDASYTMQFVSSNHCQKGSNIDVYRIIF
jgi:hypothetical protein